MKSGDPALRCEHHVRPSLVRVPAAEPQTNGVNSECTMVVLDNRHILDHSGLSFMQYSL
jgi:hypothetical protein